MRCRATLLSTLIAFGLVACQGFAPQGSTPSAGARLAAVLDSGELRVGTSADLPPLTMKDSKGEIRGFEPDLIEALADAMNLEIRYVVKPFSELLPSLERGEVDLVIAGMTITPRRNARVAFAGPYFISGKAALTKSPSLAAAGDPKDINKRTRMTVLAGSTSEQFARRELPEVELVAVDDYDDAVRLVLNNEVEVMIADYPVCILALYQNPEAGLVTTISMFSFEPIGVALSSDAHLLINVVQNYFTLLEGTGTLERLRAAWFDDASWVLDLP